MKKKFLKLLKNFILSFVLLYALNTLLINMDIFVPINIYTIGISTLLGPFGTISLVILSFIII